MLAALSCIRHSMVVVPLYETLGADAAYILAHTEAPLVVIDTLKRFENVFSMRDKTQLKHVLLTKRPEEAKWQEAQQKAVDAGLTLHLMEDLMAQGAAQTAQPLDHPPRADDTYIVWFVAPFFQKRITPYAVTQVAQQERQKGWFSVTRMWWQTFRQWL